MNVVDRHAWTYPRNVISTGFNRYGLGIGVCNILGGLGLEHHIWEFLINGTPNHATWWNMHQTGSCVWSLMEKFVVLRYLNHPQYAETALSEKRLPLDLMVRHHVSYCKLPLVGVCWGIPWSNTPNHPKMATPPTPHHDWCPPLRSETFFGPGRSKPGRSGECDFTPVEKDVALSGAVKLDSLSETIQEFQETSRENNIRL